MPWLALRYIDVQQQRVSSTEQSRCVHVLLKLISVAAIHIHDEGQEVLGFSCFELQYSFTVAADQVVEHTSNERTPPYRGATRVLFWFWVWRSQGRDGCADEDDNPGLSQPVTSLLQVARRRPVWGVRNGLRLHCCVYWNVPHSQSVSNPQRHAVWVATFTRTTPPLHKMPTTTPTRTSSHRDDTTEEGSNLVIAELLVVNWVPSAQHSSNAGQGLRQNL